MTKRLVSLATVVALLVCMLCACGETPAVSDAPIVVTDSVGREISVPNDPVSICTVCPFTGQMAILLGAGLLPVAAVCCAVVLAAEFMI